MISYTWDGSTFTPLHRFAKRCQEEFGAGEIVTLERVESRSRASHNHFFARLYELWLNLPETVAWRFPTENDLRKHALIHTGFTDTRTLICSTKAEAQRVAAFIRDSRGEYREIAVTECAITEFTAKSQSMRAMGRKEFQRSKVAVLDYLEALVLTERELAPTNTAPSLAPSHPSREREPT